MKIVRIVAELKEGESRSSDYKLFIVCGLDEERLFLVNGLGM
jgi:hypothetical protein